MNIADNGGLKQAYIAYNNWLSERGTEGKLPGMKYTTSQLFWISAAQIWCTVTHPKYIKDQIITGAHSPPQFRVIGSISNQPDFAFDFNCKKCSKMNPKTKCEVW